MARITVEDCVERVPNMFQLVLIAAKRARQLANGAEPMVDWENDKPTIVALREIAEGLIGPDILNESPFPEIEVETQTEDISILADAIAPQPDIPPEAPAEF